MGNGQNMTLSEPTTITSDGIANDTARNATPTRARRSVASVSRGRYPFMTAATIYLERKGVSFSDDTREVRARSYTRVTRELVALRAAGKMTTTNPQFMTEDDVLAYKHFIAAKGINTETQRKQLQYLDEVCKSTGNRVVTLLKERGEPWPGKVRHVDHTIEEQNLMKIIQSASEMEGWRGAICYLIASLYPGTGARPSELREAQIEDLYRKDKNGEEAWFFFVRHPKGEGKWGQQRNQWVLPFAYPAIHRYLAARTEYLAEHGKTESQNLFPCLYYKDDDHPYSEKEFRVLKALIEKKCGIKFQIKDYRPSWGQLLLDCDSKETGTVSVLMGHASTKTTEQYYARVKNTVAIEKAQRMWAERSNTTETVKKEMETKQEQVSTTPDKKASNESAKWMTGYA